MSASSLIDTAAGGARDHDPSDARLAVVSDLADHLGQTMHALQRARAQVIARGGDGATDWNTRVVLAKIVMTGPKRVSELADAMQTDASTVSRQVAAMVKDGLLERQADPGDGRASLLVATERGREAMDQFRQIRTREFARLLDDWTTEECATFSRLLSRFAADLHQHTPEESASTVAAATKEN